MHILSWPKSLFSFFHTILKENPHGHFAIPMYPCVDTPIYFLKKENTRKGHEMLTLGFFQEDKTEVL